jgi:hypothetical protein
LRRENQRLTAQLRQAETIIEVQKKLSEILGIPLPPPESSENEHEGLEEIRTMPSMEPPVSIAATCRR